MIYFDSTYLGRLYLQEPGSSEVRRLAAAHGAVTCCELGQAEIASILHRKLREGAIRSDEHATFVAQLQRDIERGTLEWLPVTPTLIASRRARALALVSAMRMMCGTMALETFPGLASPMQVILSCWVIL